MNKPITREEQIELADRLLSRARELGYTKVSVDVTRGGTLKVDAEVTESDKVARVQWGTGRGK